MAGVRHSARLLQRSLGKHSAACIAPAFSRFYKFEKTGTLSRITVKNIEGLEERESLGADLDSGSQFWILHRGVPYNGQNERTYSTGSYPAPARSSWNYANNVYEYNQVLQDCNIRKRSYLLRDVYEDMQMDGVRPVRDTFHTLITGCMKGQRVQDVLYFFDEMKAMGLAPDIVLYNCVISTCGSAHQIYRAFQIAEEMETRGIQPKHRTFLALLNACGTAGRVREAYGVVQRMAASGLTLNYDCYSALITAYKNKRPSNEETFQKIFELVEQSKGCEKRPGESEGVQNDFEEELANRVTGGELQPTHTYLVRRLNVYYTALRACGELRNIEAMKRIAGMLESENYNMDATCVTELVKCYSSVGEIENAVAVVDKFIEAGKTPTLTLYITLIQCCLSKLNRRHLAAALKVLQQMDVRGYFLNASVGSMFLLQASAEVGGDFSTAIAIWDMMYKHNLRPSEKAISSFYDGLKRHKVPAGDARLAVAGEWIEKNQKRNNGGKGGHVKQSPVVEQELDQHHATEGVLSPDQDSVESLQGEEQGAETGATMATTA